ncbi:Protein kinase superfamily protein [Forsythia ovata]|uniref:non-specific serine/threonine protein kinase n=1 Tax=Forsythia ovata TaxID=205694 RepID=A0ABD1UB32_9LAMI
MNNLKYFLLVISLLLIPGSLCQNGEYATCGASFQCAGIQNITYPFWGGSRQGFCGYPGFQLNNCQGDVPILTISSIQYRVLEIDNTTQTIRVAREDLWNSICPRFLNNTILEPNLFTFSPDYPNITLYYGCNGQPITQLPSMFYCNRTQTINSLSFFRIGEALPSFPGTGISCDNNIFVPVNQTAAEYLALPTASTIVLQEALASGFSLQWSANNSVCENCIQSGGLCGTNRNSTLFACHCADRTYALTCNDTSSQTGNGSNANPRIRIFIAASAFGACILFVISILCVCFRRNYIARICGPFWRKIAKKSANLEDILEKCGPMAPKRYRYSDIKKMTASFKDKLGQGGYGIVYKGKLQDGCLVAAKVLNESKADGEEFVNEVSSISRTSHVNIVTLLGFSFEGSKRALIYEFMPNGSLDNYIYEREKKISPLGWEKIHHIAIGIAQGLQYLHNGCNTRILHLDIKPQNILLDQDFSPKISDFGLAKLCLRKESKMSMLGTRGTVGYIAPEVFSRSFGVVSCKSDVYSYGMMILEMASGRKNSDMESDHSSELYFPHWIYKCLLTDQDIKLRCTVVDKAAEAIARKMILVGLWCIQTDPAKRPSIDRVLDMLQEACVFPYGDKLANPISVLFQEWKNDSQESKIESSSEEENNKVSIEYYEPKLGDLVVGVVVSRNENKLD